MITQVSLTDLCTCGHTRVSHNTPPTAEMIRSHMRQGLTHAQACEALHGTPGCDRCGAACRAFTPAGEADADDEHAIEWVCGICGELVDYCICPDDSDLDEEMSPSDIAEYMSYSDADPGL